MAFLTTTSLAVLASLVVAALTASMSYLGWRSFQKTRNARLLFVVVAFVAFVLKSLFVAYNVSSHAVPHDAIELVSSVFDLLIAILFFLPFVVDLEG